MRRSDPLPQRPFLKWAGNKFRIIDRVRSKLPRGTRLVEPFAGSGAVFLNTEFDEYLLCDTNRDLVDLYRLLRDDGPTFIDASHRYFSGEFNNEASYYDLREEFNASANPFERAVLFIYLNRHGYNGLCRYNAKGRFNVPFGRYKRPYFPEKELFAFHRKAQQAVFELRGFEHTFGACRPGDVIYCDPPYAPLTNDAQCFTSYSAGGFDWAQQERLAALAHDTSRNGIPVLISNHNTVQTRRLYQQARLSRFQVQRYISCDSTNRSKAGELLALYA